MKKPRLLPLLLLMTALGSPALAAQTDEGRQRVPTVTRLVQLFSALESELMAALQKNDSAVIDQLLADDFELRNGAMPGTPIPRAEWLRDTQGLAPAALEQMAVHDYGTTATVSYAGKPPTRQDVFIVDVWRKSGDTWKLSVRYASPAPAGDRRIHIPSAPPQALPAPHDKIK